MSTDIRLAFESLGARAEAAAEEDPGDRISLRDHIVEVEIGAFQSERGATQRVCFNLVVEVFSGAEPLNDDVDKILSYDTLTDAVSHSLAAERLDLLETLAERIAERILRNVQARRVFVRIEKLDRGPGALGVEIVRAQTALTTKVIATEEAPRPMVVYLSNRAIGSPLLKGWIDQLLAVSTPVVLCVGVGSETVPQSGHAATQRRIDLLAVEQNAWVLAEKDSRCIVTGSRTEIDWAIQNKHLSVWAPSKIVMDSTASSTLIEAAPLAQVVWFCKQIGAETLAILGSEKISEPNLKVSNISTEQDNAFLDLSKFRRSLIGNG